MLKLQDVIFNNFGGNLECCMVFIGVYGGKHATSLVLGIGLGVIIDRIIQYIKTTQELKYSKVLEGCFGEPFYTNSFGVADVQEWSKAREELLKSGYQIIVMKAVPEQLHKFMDNLEIGKGINNYLIMAVINEETKEIAESMLVKYESLTEDLCKLLEKGDGTMVIKV